ncbi:MAG: hypothetical protein WDM90_02070 [Ferruginibacter sp.]
MTIAQFNEPDGPEQYEAFTSKGDAAGHRKDDAFSYSLYQLGGFYIETENNSATGVLQGARALEVSPPVIELYTDSVHVS